VEEMKVRTKQPVPRLYFLPSIFTLTNVFFGFLSLTSTFYGRYHWAALWIIIAGRAGRPGRPGGQGHQDRF